MKGIGVHLCQNRISIAVVEKIGKRSYLRSLYIFDRQAADVAARLREFLKAQRLSESPTAVSVPASDAIFRKFPVPFIDPREIDKIIHYEAEQYIQIRAIEELLVDFSVQREHDDKSDLFVAAIPIDTIKETLDFCQRLNIYPFCLDIDAMGLFYIAQETKWLATKVMLVDVGTFECKIVVLANGQVAMVRAIRVDLSGGINEQNALSFSGQLRATSLASVTVEKILLCGESELLVDLPEFIEKQLTIPTKRWDISPAIEISGEVSEELPAAFSAIGLALKAAGSVAGGFNFRKGEFQYNKGFDIIKKSLAVAVTLLFVLVLFSNLYLLRRIYAKREVYDELVVRAEEIYFRNQADKYTKENYWHQVSRMRRALEDRLAKAKNRVPPIVDQAPRWAALFSTVAKVRTRYAIVVEKFAIDEEQAVFEGRMENYQCFYSWKRYLEEIEWVKKGEGVKLDDAKLLKAPKDNRLEYRFKCLVRFIGDSESSR